MECACKCRFQKLNVMEWKTNLFFPSSPEFHNTMFALNVYTCSYLFIIKEDLSIHT